MDYDIGYVIGVHGDSECIGLMLILERVAVCEQIFLEAPFLQSEKVLRRKIARLCQKFYCAEQLVDFVQST